MTVPGNTSVDDSTIEPDSTEGAPDIVDTDAPSATSDAPEDTPEADPPIAEATVSVLASDLQYPSGIVALGNALFVIDRPRIRVPASPDELWRVPLDGATPVLLATLDYADLLYSLDQLWVLGEGGEGAYLRRVNPSDGSAVDEVKLTATAQAVTHNSQHAFISGNAYVVQCSLEGTDCSTLWMGDAEHQVWRIAATDEAVYASINPAEGLTGEHHIVRIGFDSTTLDLASSDGQVTALAVVGSEVIYVSRGSNQVSAVPTAGGAVRTLAEFDGPWSLAANETYVYVSSRPEECVNSGTIRRIAIADGTTTVLADEQPCPATIILNGDYLYWVNTGSGSHGTETVLGSIAQLPVYL